ncbi:MAG: lipoprotein signal peptidase [Oscillospiraceae bacterium]|nr:lipoprotein signal peptidase [Oscillospiraceae bacterium]
MMIYIALASIIALAGIDQYLKFLAVQNLSNQATVPLIKNVLHLTYLENEGAAFGSMKGQQWILIGVTLAVIAVAIFFILNRKIKNNFLLFSISIVIAGGIGNLIDRIFRHYVIDYIDVRFPHFAVFNFADCCVVVGTILILFYLLVLEPRANKKDKEDKVISDLGSETVNAE